MRKIIKIGALVSVGLFGVLLLYGTEYGKWMRYWGLPGRGEKAR